jgi:hypothetical protein
MDDDDYELEELFTVVLSNPVGASLGSNFMTTIAISANDRKPGTLSLSTYPDLQLFTSEGSDKYPLINNIVRVKVSRASFSDGQVSVAFRTKNIVSDGTIIAATADVDYKSTSGTLTWDNGDISDKFIDLEIINDDILENSEQFILRFENPSPPEFLSTSFAELLISIVGPNDLPVIHCLTSNFTGNSKYFYP